MYYYSLSDYLKAEFGQKLYKLSLAGGVSCPNRDGTKGDRGCIFCSAGGSGEFTPPADISIAEQIEKAKSLVKNKYNGDRFIAYFQSFTSTYGELPAMEEKFMKAASRDDITALSIATRPDCLPPEVVNLLARINEIKPVFVELGLQTIHEKTAEYIRRGFGTEVFDDAVKRLKSRGIRTVVHLIIGLPFETAEDMFNSVAYVGRSGADGIKLQLLHVLKGTDLADEWQAGKFTLLTLEEYTDILCRCIELLPPDMVIHRLTGDGDKRLLLAPLWSGNKRAVLNHISRVFRERNITQGRLFRQ